MRINSLFFFCLLSVSVFSISCFSMQPMEDEYKQQKKSSKCQRKNKNRRDRQRALKQLLMGVAQKQEEVRVEEKESFQEQDIIYSKEQEALNEALFNAFIEGNEELFVELIDQGADWCCLL